MNFYKLTDIFNHDDIYVNPSHIEMYEYCNGYVLIRLVSGKYEYVDKSDFENMMHLEGAFEY